MQTSRSQLSSWPKLEHAKDNLGLRPRARSSLDTFVIPGRIRVPSSNPNVADLHIAQELLNHSIMPPPSNQPQSRGPRVISGSACECSHTQDGSPVARPASRAANRTGSRVKQLHRPPVPVRVRQAVTLQPPPRFGSQEIILVPHQRPRRDTVHEVHASSNTPDHAKSYTKTYDGPNDLPEVAHLPSRMTSMSWSTLSQRVFTNSSGSSHYSGAQHYLEEYNQLAEKHGLHHMAEAPSSTLNAPLQITNQWLFTDMLDLVDDDKETKVTTKAHQHNWLARKLFRRSSSTYTLKAKTTYKPLTRKKSLGGIPLLSDGAPKNTLRDKSLEEVGRLGGLGIIILPHEFGVDKLILPTCLSATATYLCQHGCNAPGIFRVPGQTTTIGALYNFYDRQFSQAGSPSKVEETVGCGQLPTHIEYSVPDVASVFKKIIIELPGGLLGSLELFEALRDIFFNLRLESDMSESDRTALRAKLVALAILSVTSTYRVYLIQAVLGLVAYFASEAEKTLANDSTTDGQEQQNEAKSELMGYQSLAVVLGPLLLGDMAGDIEIDGSGSCDDAIRPSIDSTKKTKKQKRNAASNKVEKRFNLTAQVEMANLTSSIMQSLLLIWKDVVRQLRGFHSTSSWQTSSSSHPKNVLSNAGSRLSLKTSDEDMLFLDVLRGRTLPDEFRGGAVQIRGKVRISSRSPMSRGAIKFSKDDPDCTNATMLRPVNEEHNGGRSRCTNEVGLAVQDIDPPGNARESSLKTRKDVSTEEFAGIEDDEPTSSDSDIDNMAMGTILPPQMDSPLTKRSNRSRGHASLSADTPLSSKRQRSSSDAPETAVKVMHAPLGHTLPATKLQWSLDKPLPPIGDVQRAEVSPPHREVDAAVSSRDVSQESSLPEWAEEPTSHTAQISSGHRSSPRLASSTGSFPPRQSSLPREFRLPMQPIETYESLAEYRANSDAYMVPPKSAPSSRKASDVQCINGDLSRPDEKRSSVKMLAQQFAEASRANRKDEEGAKDSTLPTIYAYIKPLSPKRDDPLEDPFTEWHRRTPSPERETLIPKPVQNIGRGRRASNRSLSPPKSVTPMTYSGKPASVCGVVPDEDAEIVRKNAATFSLPQIGTDSEDPSSRYSRIFDCLMSTVPSNPPVAHPNGSGDKPPSPRKEEKGTSSPVPTPVANLARSESSVRPKSPNLLYGFTGTPSRTNSYLNASDALKPLERHGSMNATLYKEIIRLQRLLEQKGEEVQAARRGLDAVRDTSKEGDIITDQGNGHGRWSMGKLDEEIREARKEAVNWRRRAQAAEERLRGMGGLAGVGAGVIDQGDRNARETLAVKRKASETGREVFEKKGSALGMNVEVKVWKAEEGRSEEEGQESSKAEDENETF